MHINPRAFSFSSFIQRLLIRGMALRLQAVLFIWIALRLQLIQGQGM